MLMAVTVDVRRPVLTQYNIADCMLLRSKVAVEGHVTHSVGLLPTSQTQFLQLVER